MDSIPEKDFFGIFQRISDYVDFSGAMNFPDPAAEIERRVKASKAYKKHPSTWSKKKKHWVRAKGDMKRLLEKGIADRIVREFRSARKLDNMIRLTLLWGKEKALEIKKVLSRKRLGRPTKRAKREKRRVLEEERRIAEVGAKGLTLRERIFGERRKRRW